MYRAELSPSIRTSSGDAVINTLGSIHPRESWTSMPEQMGQHRLKGKAFKACEHGLAGQWAPKIHLFQRITAARGQERMVVLGPNWNTTTPLLPLPKSIFHPLQASGQLTGRLGLTQVQEKKRGFKRGWLTRVDLLNAWAPKGP